MKQHSRLSDRAVLAHLVPSFIAMAWLGSKASWFWSHQPDLQFGWVVSLLCAYMFWEVWQIKPTVRLRLSWFSLLAAACSISLLFVFQVYQAALGLKPAAMVGLALAVMLMVVANLHVVFGWAGVRRLLFPYAFLLIALPMPSVVQGVLVVGLQHQVAHLTVELLSLVGVPADLQGSVIQLSVGPVGVDDACSGIRSLQSTLMATLFIGFLMLKGIGLRCLLLLAGMALAIIGNLGRVLFLSWQAHTHGIEAIDASHDAAGWTILMFTVVGVVLISWMLARLQSSLDPLTATTPGQAA